ncbi:MAG: DUF5655 domain-containing protein [Rhodoplanes sp.]
MADPKAAAATQLRNIEARTGRTMAELGRLIADSGLAKIGEQRSMLMKELGLGYGDANTVALHAKEAAAQRTGSAGADPLETIYNGNKAGLRPLHDHVIAAIDQFGPYEKAPKKTYVSLRRKKQFAMVGPATKEQIEIGLNARELPSSSRLKSLPVGGMCQFAVRISTKNDVDADVVRWLRAAYEAAG